MKGLKTISVAQKKPEAQLKKRKADPNVKKEKKANKKNSGAPKRPVSAFLIFMEDFRKSYKENFPDNKSMAAVGKAGGEKWKSLSESEKAPFVAKASKKKAEYDIAVEEYKKKTQSDNAIEEKPDSDKSTSEVHDEEDQEASS